MRMVNAMMTVDVAAHFETSTFDRVLASSA